MGVVFAYLGLSLNIYDWRYGMKVRKILQILLVTVVFFMVFVSSGFCRVFVETSTVSGVVMEVNAGGKLKLDDGQVYYPASGRESLANNVRVGEVVHLRYQTVDGKNIYFELADKELPASRSPQTVKAAKVPR